MRTPLTWIVVILCALSPLAGRKVLAQDAPEVGVADGKEISGLSNIADRIAFLSQGDVLCFRNIRVKSLAE